MLARLPLVILGGIAAAVAIILAAGMNSSEGAVPASPTCYDWCRTPSPTPGPTVAATPKAIAWADMNCNGSIDMDDAMLILRELLGMSSFVVEDCPEPGEQVGTHYNGVHSWADIDCVGGMNGVDALLVALLQASLGYSQGQDCPQPYEYISYGGT